MVYSSILELMTQSTTLFLLFFFFMTGSIFGSFVSVLYLRYPYKLDLSARSACPKCETQLRSIELVPILSYIFLGGRCRHCKSRISFIYPLLEVTTGFLVLLPFVYSNTWLVLCAWQVFTIIGLALTLIDARHKKLPNELTIGLLVIVLVLLGTDSLLSGSFAEFKRAILISCLTFSLFLAISLVSNGGLGMGDVKFLASISLLSGYISGFTVYVSIMIALVLASVFSIYQVIVKGAGRKTSIPLGPFLYFGAVLGPMFTTFVHNFILG